MIKTTWSQLKSQIDSKSLSYQMVQDDNSYTVSVVDGNFSLVTIIPISNPASYDQVDFETNYKANANAPIRANVVQVLGKDSLTLCPFGALIEPNANSFTNCDIPLPATMTLKGGVLFSENATIGDWVTISVIDKDNVLGAGGTPDNPTVLGTYVISWYIMPGQINLLEDISISQSLPQGVYMRIGYTSVGLIAPKVLVNFISYVGNP